MLFLKYGERVNFIIVYTVDAHPSGDESPYSGDEWTARYSIDEEGNPVGQPQNYEERVDLARKTMEAEELKTPLVVDEMDNPVWCTYGPAPNIAYLIGRDGKVITKQQWYDPAEMETAILDYFKNN